VKHVIIGTAGHVDHGKTALVKALTGQDTDRLKEEKERGISIDIGFAHLPLTNQLDASIVDVPGHERFLKNMLAGAGGIDLALLVVAADEGVMPQTIEHLAMLNQYEVKTGIVAVTKIDKTDSQWLELIIEEIGRLTKDTFLATAPVFPVSSLTGQGMHELRHGLVNAADSVTGRDANAPFRLWIDRVFLVKGHGVVVTGSILSGSVVTGQVLRLEPLGAAVKVRGLECHGKTTSQSFAGQRAAINLSGVDGSRVERGMLLSCPERSQVSKLWDVTADWSSEVKSGTRIRLHIGTGEWIGRVRRPRLLPTGMVRLSLERPLPGGTGERGIVRLYSPQVLIGGITLLATAPVHRSPGSLANLVIAMKRGGRAAFLATMVTGSPKPLSLAEIRRAAGYLDDQSCLLLLESLEQQEKILRLGDSYLSSIKAAQLCEQLQLRLKQAHAAAPAAAGLVREEARQSVGLEEKWFDHLLLLWEQKRILATNGAVVALPEHRVAHGVWLEDVKNRVEQALGTTNLIAIDGEVLARELAIKPSEAKPIYDSLLQAGDLVRLGEIFVYRKTLQYNVSRIQAYLQDSVTATVAELRDLLQTTRKLLIPLLEYSDMHKYTLRNGDVRRVGSRKP
jgi:selenocysteine-specific elongation factor